jgi:branched-chain amino acid transport system permease protein
MEACRAVRKRSAMSGDRGKALVLHLVLIALLFGLQFVLPAYHHLVLARVMVFATFATGYNLLFGYTGLLSLGHAMFFAAGLYGAGIAAYHFQWKAEPAFLAGAAAGLALSLGVGLLALRTTGVAFMIVTLMFSQALYLLILYFGDYTRGDEGFTIPAELRRIELLALHFDLADPGLRYNLALALLAFAIALTLVLVRSPTGRVLIAIRENEDRARMLGYDTFRYKLFALCLSGTLAALAGAAYALLFGYVGATFASIQYSIFSLLWTLMGGAGTVAGPLLGTVLMFYLVEISSDYLRAYFLVVGLALVLLILFFPRGILGTAREKFLRWLP